MSRSSKAVLINPPVYDFALYDMFLKPYGLMKIGAWLDRSGWQVEYVDALDYTDEDSVHYFGMPKRKQDGTGKFFRQVVPKPPKLERIDRNFARYGILRESYTNRLSAAVNGTEVDIVLITSGMTYWYPGIKETVELVREKFPGAVIIVGGVYATLLPNHCKEVCVPDYVVSGDAWSEDENSLPAILKKLGFPAGIGPADFPAADSVSLLRDAAVVQLTRGCPNRCTYCASKRFASGFKRLDMNGALEYLDLLSARGIRNIAFYDDALLADKEKTVLPFLHEVARRKYGFNFYTPNAVHIKYIDNETAGLMKQAGFRELRIGLESTEANFHRKYDNKFSLSDFSEKGAVLRSAGFRSGEVTAYVLAGLPGQYAEEVEASVRTAGEAGVRVMLSRYSPVPGSPLWEEAVRRSRYPIDEEPLFQNNTFFSMEWEGFTREDLRRLHELAVTSNQSLR